MCFLVSLAPDIFLYLFGKPPCPTSLNIVLYSSRWRPPLTVPRQKLLPPCHSDADHPSRTCLLSPTELSHKFTYPTSSSLQSRTTIQLTAILFEFLYHCIMFPNTGKIPDMMIFPALACFDFFSSFLYFSTIAVVPSFSTIAVVPPVRSRLRALQQSQSSSDPAGKDSATSSPMLTEAGTSVRLSFQSRRIWICNPLGEGDKRTKYHQQTAEHPHAIAYCI